MCKSDKIRIKFHTYNWWGNAIYITDKNTYLVYFDGSFYSLSDKNDIDSDPNYRISNNKIKIVNEF